jgi:PAS domain S-box-containing protein
VIDPETLLARSTDVVSVVDERGTVRYQSPSVERVLGYGPEALFGEPLLSYVHEADRDVVRDVLDSDPGAPSPQPVDHRFRTADGDWRWLETRPTPDYDVDDGSVVVTSRDVTRRKRAERASDRLLDRLDDGVLGLDDDWTITYRNEAAQRILCGDEPILVGDDVRDVLDAGCEETVLDQLDEAKETGEPVVVETHVESSDATVEIRAFPARNGLSLYVRDVSEPRRIKRELERTVEALQKLYEVAADADLTIAEKQSRLLETGRHHLDLPYGFITRITDDRQLIVDAVGDHRLLQSGNSCPIEESYCRKTLDTDGLLAIRDAVDAGWETDPAYERFELGSYIGGRIEVGGELYGTLCFAAADSRARAFTDSERTFVELASRWLAYELEEARYQRRLERQNERLDNFASILSHDLRNPLNVAHGRLELLAEECSDRENLDEATDALDRAFDIIDDVLAFSRAGGDVLDCERISLPAVADRAWAIVDPDDAVLDVAPDAGTVGADETRLQQLLENLFGNAVAHGGEGVTVTVGRLDEDEGFYVADDGPGIPPGRREQVFELGHTDAEDGSGLGLAIVDEIADVHGWRVRVIESQVGGARFDVCTDCQSVTVPE